LVYSIKSVASPEAVESWIANNHIVAPLAEELPSSLKKNLEYDLVDKRMVFLGESDHYFHEKFKYRLKFIEALLEQGFYNIVAELGVADGKMVNAFLETGDEKYLKQVGLYGFRYGNELVYREGNFVKEVVRYYKKLRLLKQKYPQLTYSGFDLDIYPGTFLLEYDSFKETDLFTELLSNKSFRSFIVLIERIKKNADNINKYPEVKDIISLVHEAQFLSELFPVEYKAHDSLNDFLFDFYVFKESVLFKKLMLEKNYSSESFYWREQRMFKIMAQRFKKDPPTHKYIFLGHNGHLLKTDELDENGERYTPWDTIGAWITKAYPSEVYAIWSLIGQGEHSGHGCPFGNTCSFEAKENSLEESLLEISPQKEIYFRNSEVIQQYESKIFTLVNASSPAWGLYGAYADAFYFIPVVQDLKAEEN
jgi:erythromycin esterase-like protein